MGLKDSAFVAAREKEPMRTQIMPSHLPAVATSWETVSSYHASTIGYLTTWALIPQIGRFPTQNQRVSLHPSSMKVCHHSFIQAYKPYLIITFLLQTFCRAWNLHSSHSYLMEWSGFSIFLDQIMWLSFRQALSQGSQILWFGQVLISLLIYIFFKDSSIILFYMENRVS